MTYRIKYARIGSISHGTVRDEDLISAFSYELNSLLKKQVNRFLRKAMRKLIRECNAWLDQDEDSRDYGSELVNELFDALNEFAAPYCTFGSHEGDGSDYGFWPCTESLENDVRDGVVLKVNDLSELPRTYQGEAIVVSDHGNVTLYYSSGTGQVRELWACV